MDASTWAAVAVVAAATVGGAAGARVFRNPQAALRLAATVLVAVVALDLAPDVVRDVAGTGSVRWLVAVGCGAGFAAAAAGARWVCACGRRPAATTGAAIALHRTLEGAALVVVGSPGVVAALVLHAAGEGFALQASGAGRARSVLLLACASPALGAAALRTVAVPDAVAPVLTAAVAGALVAGAVQMVGAARRADPVLGARVLIQRERSVIP